MDSTCENPDFLQWALLSVMFKFWRHWSTITEGEIKFVNQEVYTQFYIVDEYCSLDYCSANAHSLSCPLWAEFTFLPFLRGQIWAWPFDLLYPVKCLWVWCEQRLEMCYMVGLGSLRAADLHHKKKCLASFHCLHLIQNETSRIVTLVGLKPEVELSHLKCGNKGLLLCALRFCGW